MHDTTDTRTDATDTRTDATDTKTETDATDTQIDAINTQTDDDQDRAATARHIRYRRLFASYRAVLVVAIVLIVLAGAWLTYGAYASPDETVEERTVEGWSTTGELSHSATVTTENALYEEGTVLEDEPLYYTRLSPTATGRVAVSYGAEAGEATVDLEIREIVRATGDDITYWEASSVVDATTVDGVAPNEPVEGDFEVPIESVGERIAAIEEDLGASPGETEIVYAVTVQIDGTIEGDQRVAAETHEVVLDVDGGTYAFEGSSFEESYPVTETETVAVSPGPVRSIGGPLLVVIGLVGLSGVALASYRFEEPTPIEREWLAFRADHEEYGDLVTTARLPPSAYERDRATVSSLETLALLAIDVESALVYDLETGQYTVLDGDIRYAFDPLSLTGGVEGKNSLSTARSFDERAVEHRVGESGSPAGGLTMAAAGPDRTGDRSVADVGNDDVGTDDGVTEAGAGEVAETVASEMEGYSASEVAETGAGEMEGYSASEVAETVERDASVDGSGGVDGDDTGADGNAVKGGGDAGAYAEGDAGKTMTDGDREVPADASGAPTADAAADGDEAANGETERR